MPAISKQKLNVCAPLLSAPQQVGIKNKGLQQWEENDQFLKGSSSKSVTRCFKLATT